MAKDEFVAWATDGEMFGEEVEVVDVDDTGDGYGAEALESVDLVVGDEPEEGVEFDVVEGSEIDELRTALASAVFASKSARLMMVAIARNADSEAKKTAIEISVLRRHAGRLEARCKELTEMLAIYEQEMGWPPVVRPRPGILGRLLQAVWPWG
jgi:hypothetical protein